MRQNKWLKENNKKYQKIELYSLYMTLSYINSRTINHDVIYSYTLLYGFNQQLTNPDRGCIYITG